MPSFTDATAVTRLAELSRATLGQHLTGHALDWELVAMTGSTHSDLTGRARRAAPVRPLLRAATEQTAGRGRHGRAWHGTVGGSLLFSLALPWRRAPGASAAVTLACALAAARTLRTDAAAVLLKWPNDLMLDGGKLAGMLAELAADPAGETTLVVSLGLNLLLDDEQRRSIDQPAADLSQCLGRAAALAQREARLARLALAVLSAAQRFEVHGFAELRPAFNALFAWRDRAVALVADGRTVRTGIARGVDADGRLQLESHGDIDFLAAGELRLQALVPGPDTHLRLDA